MTKIQRQFIQFLENLVGSRTTLEKLEKEISNYLKEDITIEDVSCDDNDISDYNAIFESQNDETYGYFDIYFLKMRRPGFDGANIYITEIGYEYE